MEELEAEAAKAKTVVKKENDGWVAPVIAVFALVVAGCAGAGAMLRKKEIEGQPYFKPMLDEKSAIPQVDNEL